jgi:hypothetical protein
MSKKTETIKEAMEVATEILKDTRNTSTEFMEIVVEYVRQVEKVEEDLKPEPKK